MNKSLDGNSNMWYKITGIKMFENSLSDWRKMLLVREEPLSVESLFFLQRI